MKNKIKILKNGLPTNIKINCNKMKSIINAKNNAISRGLHNSKK
jgi:hypothetical protein